MGMMEINNNVFNCRRTLHSLCRTEFSRRVERNSCYVNWKLRKSFKNLEISFGKRNFMISMFNIRITYKLWSIVQSYVNINFKNLDFYIRIALVFSFNHIIGYYICVWVLLDVKGRSVTCNWSHPCTMVLMDSCFFLIIPRVHMSFVFTQSSLVHPPQMQLYILYMIFLLFTW